MTPREVYAAIRAANWRIKYQHDEHAWQAWHTAALMRQKSLPPLKELIDPPKTRPLTEEEAKEHKEFHKKAMDALPERLKKNMRGN